MRVWQGEAPIDVVYFRVGKDTPFIPFASQMRSQECADPRDNSGIGEQYPYPDPCFCLPRFGPYYKGMPPAFYLGRHVCGSQQAWEEGGVRGRDPVIVTGFGGRPDCCPTGTVLEGGLSFGGSAYPPPSFTPVLAWGFGTLGGPASVDLSAAPDAPGRIYLWVADTALAGGIFALPGGFTVLESSVVPGEIALIVAYKDVPSVRGVYTVPGAPDIQPLVAAGAFPFVPVQVGVLPARGSGPVAVAPDVYLPTGPGWQVSYFLSFETANVIFTDPSTDSVGGSGEQGSMVLAILLQLASGTVPGENALIQPTPGPWIGASLGIGM